MATELTLSETQQFLLLPPANIFIQCKKCIIIAMSEYR